MIHYLGIRIIGELRYHAGDGFVIQPHFSRGALKGSVVALRPNLKYNSSISRSDLEHRRHSRRHVDNNMGTINGL
jgi:hypothetical protein